MSGILSVPFTYLAVVAASDRTKIIYALLALSGILIATYRVWAKERRALVSKVEEAEELRVKLQNIPGPEFRLAYDTSQGDMLNWPLAIQNLKGGNAYGVVVEGLKFGPFVANLSEVHIIEEGQTWYPQSGDGSNRYCHLLAALAAEEEVRFPVLVRCRDSSNRRFVHRFEFHYRKKAIPSFRPIERNVL
ncbi:MAG: hypothetical protein WCC97_15310 [Candidatus Acidiferrales bacterium]